MTKRKTDKEISNALLIEAAPELLAACEAALPWVAIAIAGRINPHPQAVKNHAEDLARLRAAIKKAKGAE